MLTIDASILRVQPHGDLTIYQVEELSKELVILLANTQEVSVDFSKVDKIDTAGFQLIVSLQKSCVELGKKFEVSGIYDSVENFMNLYNFDFSDKQKGNT